jgi:hypothetical protein
VDFTSLAEDAVAHRKLLVELCGGRGSGFGRMRSGRVFHKHVRDGALVCWLAFAYSRSVVNELTDLMPPCTATPITAKPPA